MYFYPLLVDFASLGFVGGFDMLSELFQVLRSHYPEARTFYGGLDRRPREAKRDIKCPLSKPWQEEKAKPTQCTRVVL